MSQIKRLARANERLVVLNRKFDQAIEQDKVLSADAARISCRKGCSHCCEQFVMLTFPEAQLIAEKHPDVVRAALPKLHAQEEQFVAMDGATALATDGPTRSAFYDRWFQTRTKCPFLGEDNLCGIYESRPSGCRTYFVIDEPAKCAERPIPGMPGANVLAWYPRSTEALQMALFQHCINLFGQLMLGPLQVLVLYAHEGKKKP